MPQVRLIDSDGSQIGIKARDEALEYAWAQDLDLVEVAPEARPPVCRVMDYSKYKYEQEQKAKLARKHQSTITIKEIKLRPKVGAHDYETKRGHVIRFLKNRDKVKVTIMFRGRETTHPERGRNLLLRLAEDVKDIAVIESEPLQDGRNMVMMLGPTRLATPVGTGDGEAIAGVLEGTEVDGTSEAVTAAPAVEADPAAPAAAAAPQAVTAALEAEPAEAEASPAAAAPEAEAVPAAAAPEAEAVPAAAAPEAEAVPAAAAPEAEAIPAAVVPDVEAVPAAPAAEAVPVRAAVKKAPAATAARRKAATPVAAKDATAPAADETA